MSWLFEGFTDYYAEITALKSGIVSLKQVIERYNRLLEKHYLSFVREKSNNDLEAFFDEDSLYADLPYTRGYILAHELDTKINQSTNKQYSLDDVFKNLFKNINIPSSHTASSCLTYLGFKNEVHNYFDDSENFFKMHVDEGKIISPLSNSFGECVSLIEKNIKPEDYGIDLKKTISNKEIIGLNKNNPAYVKGLRNGQKIVSYKFKSDINKELELKVEMVIGKKYKTFNLKRLGNPINIPQYKINEKKFKENPEICMSYLR